MRKFLIALTALSFAAPSVALAEWVPAERSSCKLVCESKKLKAVEAGNRNGRPFYVCRASAEGERPGYNVQPSWANVCGIGQGGAEKLISSYSCLCR